MPQQWAVAQESAGTQKFRTASGQELEDAGGIRKGRVRQRCLDEHAPHRGTQATRLSTQSAEAERGVLDLRGRRALSQGQRPR
eukprot:4888398-Amphidinium_carterae.1